MEQAPNNDKIAARVKRTMGKDQEFHARNLERNEEKKKGENEVQSPPEPAMAEGEGSEGASRAQVGGSSSSSTPSSAVPAPSSRKRGAGDQLDQARESPGFQSSGTEASSPQEEPLSRPSATKRPAEGEPEIRWRSGDESGPQSEEKQGKEKQGKGKRGDPQLQSAETPTSPLNLIVAKP